MTGQYRIEVRSYDRGKIQMIGQKIDEKIIISQYEEWLMRKYT